MFNLLALPTGVEVHGELFDEKMCPFVKISLNVEEVEGRIK